MKDFWIFFQEKGKERKMKAHISLIWLFGKISANTKIDEINLKLPTDNLKK